jgi:hypothetical protein
VRAGVLAAVVFVVGLLVGGVTVAFLDDDPVAVEVATVPDADRGGEGPSLPADGAAAQFVVSGACLGAVNAAQDTALVVDDLGQAAAQLDAARLDEIVRQLMPLQTRLEAGLDACRVATAVDVGGEDPSPATGATGSPAPTTGPGAGD